MNRATWAPLEIVAGSMSGVTVPAHAIPPAPRVLTASRGTVIWRGSAGAGTYTIQRATAATGPWQTVCNACVTDTSGGWTDPAPLGSPAWYQVLPLNLDNMSGPASSPVPDGTTAWVEDATPTGASLWADGGDAWTWVATNPHPYAGTLAHQSAIANGEEQHYFTGATTTITPHAGSLLYTWVYLDPTHVHVPTTVMLQWNDGQAGDPGWQHRAYWGTNCTEWGVEGTVSRFHAGNLPPAGGWVQLAVPASAVGIENVTISGMAFTTCDGQATYDRAGVA